VPENIDHFTCTRNIQINQQVSFSISLPGGYFHDLDDNDIDLIGAMIARKCDTARQNSIRTIDIYITGVFHEPTANQIADLDSRVRYAIKEDVKELGTNSNLYCGDVTFILRYRQ
jgi:hypothetical protein